MSPSSVVVIVFLLSTLIPLSEQRLMKKGSARCFGAPLPAEDICINFLEYDSEGLCTGLTCDVSQWYDCFDGAWILATVSLEAPLDPDCWFDGDLYAVCDCPTIASRASKKRAVGSED